jgi:hypothetical protein
MMRSHQVSLPSQLVLINMSLAINDALMHIPNFYVFWNLGSIVSGAIFYHVRRTFVDAVLAACVAAGIRAGDAWPADMLESCYDACTECRSPPTHATC